MPATRRSERLHAQRTPTPTNASITITSSHTSSPLTPLESAQRLNAYFYKIFFWQRQSGSSKLTEQLVRDHKDFVDWKVISQYQTLSEAFIREFHERVDWSLVSRYQTLSEAFIREFQHRVDWRIVSKRQILSEAFIREFQHKVDWMRIFQYQNISWQFEGEHFDHWFH
jgi:hypothetical protein